MIVKRIYDVNMEEANYVFQEVKKLTDAFQIHAKESHELVQYELELEEVRTKKKGEIVTRYTNLVEWVQLMYQYPQFEVLEEIQKQVKTAFSNVGRINGMIEERTTMLQNQRKDIERKLIDENKDFQAELNEIKGQIDDFKETNNQIMKNY